MADYLLALFFLLLDMSDFVEDVLKISRLEDEIKALDTRDPQYAERRAALETQMTAVYNASVTRICPSHPRTKPTMPTWDEIAKEHDVTIIRF